jgi:hypothetical protein
MATFEDVLQAQFDRAAWAFDPDQVRPLPPRQLSPKSSAARHATRVREGEKAAEKAQNEIVDKLQAKRRQREAERARTRGLSTAEIIAAQRLGA